MPVFAGIDEAGYGPLLGPLVVTLAAFRAPEVADDDAPPRRGRAACEALAPGHDLWTRLGEEAVLRAPPPGAGRKRARAETAVAVAEPASALAAAQSVVVERASSPAAPRKDLRLVVCDSKKIYQGGKGLRRMEETVLSFLALTGRPAVLDGTSLATLLPEVGLSEAALAPYPWYAGRDLALPFQGYKTLVRRHAAALRRALASASIEPLVLAPRAVHPLEFNAGVRAAGNKHEYEWTIVASLLRALFDGYGKEGVDVVCDRLSGRDFYGDMLAAAFPEARVTAPLESGDRSVYRVTHGRRRMQVAFQVGGDEHCFSVALASCAAKYFREVFMHLMNEFFAARVPGLRATAGYYGDAQRFLGEVRGAWEAVRRERALEGDGVLVRCC